MMAEYFMSISHEALLGKGHSKPSGPVSQAGPGRTRSHSGAGGQAGLRVRMMQLFQGGQDFGNGGISLLLLADNYI
jgi:hypothetical protein